MKSSESSEKAHVSSEPAASYRFGAFVVNGAQRCLLCDGQVVSLTPKALEALSILIQNRNRVVGKDELMDALWPDSVVEENNLAQAVSALRKALGDSPLVHRMIATVPGRGYRFVADVTELPPVDLPGGDVAGVAARAAEPHPTLDDEGSAEAESLRAWSRRRAALTASILAGLAIASYLALGRRETPIPADATTPSIAVLPFRTLSGDADSEYLGVGLADTLITKIGNTRRVIIRPTSAVLGYTGPDRDPIAVGRALRVDAVLDGSVRKSGDRVRLSVQLLDVAEGTPLWGETFDETFTHVFAVEATISTKLVAALRPALRAGDPLQSVSGRVSSPDANEAYLRGRYFREKMTRDGYEKAIHYFRRAIELAPDFAAAYAGLAGCHCLLAGQGLEIERPHEAMPAAKAAALEALELDDTVAEAHAALGMIRLKYDWDWTGAERALRRAIRLNPSYAQAHLWYSIYLEAMGRTDEAVAEAETAQGLDPLSLRANINVAVQYLRANRHGDALDRIQKTLELDPSFWMAHWVAGDVHARQGDHDDAIASLAEADALSAGNPAVLSSLGSTYAAAGRTADAVQIIDRLRALGGQRYVSPSDTAAIYAALGNNDRAFEWLEKAYAERSRSLVWLNVWPQYESLRSDPRFSDLLRRIGRQP